MNPMNTNAACRNEGPPEYGNIMYDKRIVRGNTYAQHTLPAVSGLVFFPSQYNSSYFWVVYQERFCNLNWFCSYLI